MSMQPDPKQKKKKKKKGFIVVHFEPLNLYLLDENLNFEDSFLHVGCLRFCEKLQGFHTQNAKEFVLNYDGVKTKVGPLEINVSTDYISRYGE